MVFSTRLNRSIRIFGLQVLNDRSLFAARQINNSGRFMLTLTLVLRLLQNSGHYTGTSAVFVTFEKQLV